MSDTEFQYEHVKIKVKKIIYRSSDDGYTIFLFKGFKKKEFVGIGYFYNISIGEELYASGEIVDHQKYGKQFMIQFCESNYPTTKNGMLEYLNQRNIRGIGPVIARRIVDEFGENSFEIMENDPESLTKIKGISMNKALSIQKKMIATKKMRNILTFFASIGITQTYAMNIYHQFREKSVSMIKQNPYCLTRIKGIGFKKADEIASNLGLEKDSEYRLRAGIEYVLSSDADGHTYYPFEYLLKKAARELEYNDLDRLREVANKMPILEFVNRNGIEAVYLKSSFEKEESIAFNLLSLTNIEEANFFTEKDVKSLEDKLNIDLHKTQRKAVVCAMNYNLMVLTGGPGTGKTATTGVIIEALQQNYYRVALCAPTGRAAKRMSESCHMQAKTIHRLLCYNPQTKDFTYGKHLTLPYDAVIVDESSMIDQNLMCSLLDALDPTTKLILIGDENQLPSVGPGNILSDIIHSEICPVIQLTKIFRQGENSEIVLNAHHMLKKEPLSISNKKDFFFIPCDDKNLTQEKVLRYVKKELPAVTGEKEIQVLCPMRKGETGVTCLNELIQDTLNPNKERVHGFSVGDRIIQTRNNYDLLREKDKESQSGIYNGDIGIIVDYYKDEDDEEKDYWTILMDDGFIVKYPVNQYSDLELAYAITIHKSQGSEYPVVVIPLTQYIPQFTTMNLLYTAITRAKKYVCIVGSKKIFGKMIQNRKRQYRYTGLCEKLQMYNKLK